MNLSELRREVYEDERIKDMRLTKEEVDEIVDVVSESMFKGIIRDGALRIKNLFSIKIKVRKGRRIFDIKSKKHKRTRDTHQLSIEPSKRFKKELEKLNDETDGV